MYIYYSNNKCGGSLIGTKCFKGDHGKYSGLFNHSSQQSCEHSQ